MTHKYNEKGRKTLAICPMQGKLSVATHGHRDTMKGPDLLHVRTKQNVTPAVLSSVKPAVDIKVFRDSRGVLRIVRHVRGIRQNKGACTKLNDIICQKIRGPNLSEWISPICIVVE
jgi:hypothetical protein